MNAERDIFFFFALPQAAPSLPSCDDDVILAFSLLVFN
jgi:hypothetical protein